MSRADRDRAVRARPPRVARRGRAGFTMVELTVALLAGLIVALAIVGLSKEATRTFHEEIRSAAAEATLRTAVDRLEADLQRAAYMSTGNIQADPMMAFIPGGTKVPNGAPTWFRRLAGIHLYPGWSNTNNNLALSAVQSPQLAPDMIEIAGNMTTAEQFEVEAYLPSTNNCTQLMLVKSPAIYRVLNNNTGDAGVPNTNADIEFRNLFQPVPVGSTTQFAVRFVDDTGHSQYILTCPVAQAAGLVNGGVFAPYVWIDASTTRLLTATATGTVSGLTGSLATGGTVHGWVNPVQVVRWEITGPSPTPNGDPEPSQYGSALGNVAMPTGSEGGATDPNKYDLMRSFVNITDANGKAIPETSEIVAEYAVDLNFAFTVDDKGGDPTGSTPSFVSYPFDDPTDNGRVANDVSTQVTAQPQRIRSVRARVVTRTGVADRTMNVAGTDAGLAFLYRYCLTGGGCGSSSTILQWARARTEVVEVSLTNQSRSFY